MDFLQSYDKNMVPTGALVQSYDVARKRRTNSDYEISFTVPMISEDYREKIILKGHVRDERGQYYVINSRSRVREDRKLTASIMCTHVMFKLTDFKFPYASYISEAYGIHISQLTGLITAATGGRFTFSIDDTFDLFDVKDFGGGNCLQALNQIIEFYGCEVEPDNFVIHLKKKIGKDEGTQYRIKKNIISDQFKDDATSLVTRLYCQMKDGITWIGQSASILKTEERTLLEAVPGAIMDGILKVNYLISPYASTWASDSVPFFDGELIEQDIDASIDLPNAVSQLLEIARKTLREKEIPTFEVTVDGADLYKIDGEEPKPSLGDVVYCHDPDMEMVNLQARITELTEYPYTKEKHAQATIANVMLRDYDDIIADLDKSKNIVDNLFSGGRIRAAAFEEYARLAVVDINNSKTELIYPPEGGILAQDKTNPLRQVRLTSAGLGISTDGWQTLRAAITADGVMGERIVGQIGNFESLSIGHDNEIILLNHFGLAAGSANFNSAPFRVDMAGNLVANKLTANSAVINDSTFGGGAIIGSSINVGSGVFTVDTAGRMRATSGEFSGSITASTIRSSSITADTDINVTRDARIGNNLFMGLVGAVNDRRIEFVDPSIYEALISFAGSTSKEIKVRGPNDVRIDAGLNAVVRGAFDVSLEPANGKAYVGAIGVPGNRIVTASELDAIWMALTGKANTSHSHTVTLPNHNHGNPDNQNSGGGTFGVS